MTPLDGTGLAVQAPAITMTTGAPRSPAGRLLGPSDTGSITAVASRGSCLVFAVGPMGALRLVDLAEPGTPQVPLGAHGAHVRALAVWGGTAFTAGCDGRVLAWRLGAASLPVVVGAHRAGVNCAAVAGAGALVPDGSLVAAGHDGYVLAWTGPVPRSLGAHPGGVEALCLLGSGVVVTAGRDARLLVHDSGAPVELHQRRRELTPALAAVGPGALVAACGHRGAVRLWTEPGADACPEELGLHGGWVLALVVLEHNRLAALGGGHVTVWDLSTGNRIRIDLAPGVHATGGVILGSDDLAVTAPDGRVEVVEAHRWAA